MEPSFDWDPGKDAENRHKHRVAFVDAQLAFLDPSRVIARDLSHSGAEERYFLLRSRRRRGTDRPIHVSGRGDPDYWRRVLAQRQEDP